MITEDQHELLKDIIDNTERPDKLTVRLDPASRTMVVEYEDMEDEWFREMLKVLGYVIGATVRQYHHTTMFDDAIITCVHDNGALDVVRKDGTKNGWSVNTCTPVPNG